MPKNRTVRHIGKENAAKISSSEREVAHVVMEYLMEVIRKAEPFSTEWCSAHEEAMDVQSKLDGLALTEEAEALVNC